MCTIAFHSILLVKIPENHLHRTTSGTSALLDFSLVKIPENHLHSIRHKCSAGLLPHEDTREPSPQHQAQVLCWTSPS